MRRPPPVTTAVVVAAPVTATLCLIALLTTMAWALGERVSWMFLDTRAFSGEPWRLFTTVFPHIGFWHLVGNLYWLWVFGTLIEETFGHFKTALLMLFLAAGSAAIAGVFGEDGVGLSGLVYGLFGLLLVLRRRDEGVRNKADRHTTALFVFCLLLMVRKRYERFREAVDGLTIALFVASFFVCILVTYLGVLPVGNIAHGAGAILGLVTGLVVVQRWRWPVVVSLVGATMALALGVGMLWRPYLNVYRDRGGDYAYLGDLELNEGRLENAARRYAQALDLDSNQPRWWHRLGQVYVRLDRFQEAEFAFGRAAQLTPGAAENRKIQSEWKAIQAYRSQLRGNHVDAVRLYREALELDGTNAANWYNLGISYHHLNRLDEARAAYQRAHELDPNDVRFWMGRP